MSAMVFSGDTCLGGADAQHALHINDVTNDFIGII